MFQKVTAFMLALLIGSPMCWCGWMHRAPPAASTPVPSCRHAKAQDGKTEQKTSKSKDDCPCAHAPKARELVSSKVKVPEAAAFDMHLQPWSVQTTLVPHPPQKTLIGSTIGDGPPRTAEPLYLVQCALLI